MVQQRLLLSKTITEGFGNKVELTQINNSSKDNETRLRRRWIRRNSVSLRDGPRVDVEALHLDFPECYVLLHGFIG